MNHTCPDRQVTVLPAADLCWSAPDGFHYRGRPMIRVDVLVGEDVPPDGDDYVGQTLSRKSLGRLGSVPARFAEIVDPDRADEHQWLVNEMVVWSEWLRDGRPLQVAMLLDSRFPRDFCPRRGEHEQLWYGLTACRWSNDRVRAFKVLDRLADTYSCLKEGDVALVS